MVCPRRRCGHAAWDVCGPTFLSSDLEPDDLVVGARFGAPIGREFVNHFQAASLGLVLSRWAQYGPTASLVFNLDAHPMRIRMDGHADAPSGMDDGVGHELADQQHRHLGDRRLDPAVGQNVAGEDASFMNAGGPAHELDRPGHRSLHTPSTAPLLGHPTLRVGSIKQRVGRPSIPDIRFVTASGIALIAGRAEGGMT
jgi:hypothetical protein